MGSAHHPATSDRPHAAGADAGVPPALRALLTGLVDYAGLFPPAKLPMSAAVENYARYIGGGAGAGAVAGYSWALGRFICPVSKLEAFREAARGRLPGPEDVETMEGPEDDDSPAANAPERADGEAEFPGWHLSALIDGELEADLDAIFAFNHEHAEPRNGLAVIDAVEIKVPATGAAEFIDRAIESVPDEIYPFFEFTLPPNAGGGAGPIDLRGGIIALAGAEAAAKVRCGGITPEMIPHAEHVAAFIAACDAADVPFKATAGLHHPVRAEHNLTYEPGCPRGVMHGFLNVFLGAVLLRTRRITAKELPGVLLDADAGNFRFAGDAAAYKDKRVTAAEIEKVRRTFAMSYGSCSFQEPLADLRALGML